MASGAHPDLARSDRWAAAAAELLANLGFTLINSDRPAAPGGANLLVALRDRPTLRHFDPEVVFHWALVEGRGRVVQIDRTTPLRPEGRFAWGRIRIVDRLGEMNQWIGFGGLVRVADVDASTRLVGFNSPAPIFRWAGHSQGLDRLTAAVGAFFGRLMVPIDFEPGAEERIGRTDPLVLYAAFLQDALERRVPEVTEQFGDAESATWIRLEAKRLYSAVPAVWTAAAELRRDLGLARS
ncbi:MAG TPA: hypothetical protein VNO86_02770 [Candidatus Binatia bacterium]|nr:hypothetical protein [Candidatus Binatia bacterium]